LLHPWIQSALLLRICKAESRAPGISRFGTIRSVLQTSMMGLGASNLMLRCAYPDASRWERSASFVSKVARHQYCQPLPSSRCPFGTYSTYHSGLQCPCLPTDPINSANMARLHAECQELEVAVAKFEEWPAEVGILLDVPWGATVEDDRGLRDIVVETSPMATCRQGGGSRCAQGVGDHLATTYP
jgi:hypothetical protein